jgi:hypothetical protein
MRDEGIGVLLVRMLREERASTQGSVCDRNREARLVSPRRQDNQ